MNQPIKFTTRRVSRTRNSVNHSLPRRSPATVGGRWACRAVVPRRRDEGGSLITSHYSLLTVLLLALSPAPKAFGVTPPPDGGYPGANTAEGTNSLFSLTSGVWNTALGYQSLYHVTTGNQNTGIGYQTLFHITTGNGSAATGTQTLFNNTTGSFNTATGFRALYSNTTGFNNTADGFRALYGNTTGSNNTANGHDALNQSGGDYNTATGAGALFINGGSYNTAIGWSALNINYTGSGNTAVGAGALEGFFRGQGPQDNNTAVGRGALGQLGLSGPGGGGNIALGWEAGVNLLRGDNNIYIGNSDGFDEDNTIRIGTVGTQTATFIAGISGTGVTGTAVVVSSSGQLGVAPSSQRFKEQIKAMDKASEAILALKPVTFRYKKNIDPKGAAQFGLVAEEVEKVNPDLVVRDAEGKVFTVRYEAVNAMLLNEFLKEHRKVEEQERKLSEQGRKTQEQETTMTKLKSAAAKQEVTIAKQQKQIEALTTGLQKVSDQLELDKSVPQMAGNDR
jgi:uncharacterized coiled-coil protein SlyX